MSPAEKSHDQLDPTPKRIPVKLYWSPIQLQAIASPDHFARIVNDLVSGRRMLSTAIHPK